MDSTDEIDQTDQFKEVPFNKTPMNRLTVNKSFNPFTSAIMSKDSDSMSKSISKISISNPQWVGGWNPINGHRSYTIITIWNVDITKKGIYETEVQRRYSHFEMLRKNLIEKFPYHAVPLLPEKDRFEKIYTNKSSQIMERMDQLQHFLSILVSHPIFCNCEEVKEFLINSEELFSNNNAEIDEEGEGSTKDKVVKYITEGFYDIVGRVYESLPSIRAKP